MIQATDLIGKFPKSARLLRHQDFRFRSFRRYQGEYFRFIYSTEGQTRVGISVSKRVLKRSTARNRVKRLIREAFRFTSPDLAGIDVHVIGLNSLGENWKTMGLSDVAEEFGRFAEQLPRKAAFGRA